MSEYRNPGVGYFKPQRVSLSGDSPVKRQLAVYQNPFSLATNNPKIPDGKCSLSAGQRYQVVDSFANDEAQPQMYFVMYPGLGSGLIVFGSSNNKVMTYNNGTKLATLSNNEAVLVGPVPANQAIAQWRVVSQGMKLSLVNNADENDGWFESVRLTVSHEPSNWVLSPEDDPTNIDDPKFPLANLVLRPSFNNLNGGEVFGINRSAFVENATYRTGKLRDIHKHTFMLKPDSNDHDFIRLNPFQSDTEAIFDSPTGVLANHPQARDLVNNIVDDTMDVIVVCVHGRPAGAPATVSSPSQILCHLVANHEMCYEPSSLLSRFHSESYDVTKSIMSTPFVRQSMRRSAPMKRGYRRPVRSAYRRFRRYFRRT